MFTLAITFLVIWLLMLKWNRRHFERLYYEHLKISKPRFPIIGHLFVYTRGRGMTVTTTECKPVETSEKIEIMKRLQLLGMEAIRAGGITGFWIAHKLYINVADPNVAEIVLKTYLEKDDIMKCFHVATGDGSIFATVKTWRLRRKLLAPMYSMVNFNYFVKSFSEQSCVLVDKLQGETGKSVSMWKVFSLYSMDAILGSLGIEINAQKNAYHPFLVAIEEVFSAMAARIFKPWLHSDLVYKLLPRYHRVVKHKPIIYGFVDKMIQEKRTQNQNNQIDLRKGSVRNTPRTFMDLMIESGKLSDVAIREESMVIMSAGSDTSAVALAFASVMLARHPEVQDQVYKELNEVIGDVSQPISAEHLPYLKYLDAVIRETLRLYPPAPVIGRKIVKDIKLPSGVTLLAGCGIWINIWAINRNPTYWGEDAEQFRPERFLDLAPRHPAAFISFSYGPRNCLGFQYAMMSMKTVLATLLKQYRILPSPDDRGHEPLRVKFDIMMRHVDNYCVQIEPRK